MNVLMAGTGAGKNCISEPINRIMADIRERDRVNLQREREWKREMQTKGANKDKRQRPEGLVIQEIDPDMTNAAFVQRLADAEERFLYCRRLCQATAQYLSLLCSRKFRLDIGYGLSWPAFCGQS